MKTSMIVTLQLEKSAADFFTAQRSLYFPKHVNYVDAHLTLFHTLPAAEAIIKAALEAICKRNEMELMVTAIRNTGNGVAYTIASPELSAMHSTLQTAFNDLLVGKDKQQLQPHITVQNKVTAFKAQQLYEKLNVDFKPFSIKATGICTWHYLRGPWKLAQYFSFNS